MIDLLASQLPLANDYAEAVRVQWDSSRHPENLHDVTGAVKEEALTTRQKIAAAAGITAVGYALGPFNEMTLGLTVGHALDYTDSIAAGIATTPLTTGLLELAAGLGMAYVVSKFSKATDIIRDRYIKKPKENSEEDIAHPSSIKRIGRILGIVSLTGTGASGATLDQSLHDTEPEGRNKRTKKVAVTASAMLMGINAAYASVVLGIAKGAETAGAESSVDTVAEVVSNPVYVGGIMLSALMLKKQVDFMLYKEKPQADHETSGMAEVHQLTPRIQTSYVISSRQADSRLEATQGGE